MPDSEQTVFRAWSQRGRERLVAERAPAGPERAAPRESSVLQDATAQSGRMRSVPVPRRKGKGFHSAKHLGPIRLGPENEGWFHGK